MKQNSSPPFSLDKLVMLMPEVLRYPLEEGIVYAQIPTDNLDRTISRMIVGFLAASLMSGVIVFLFTKNTLYALGALAAAFFAVYFVARSLLNMLADSVAGKIEKALPDMLLLMSANLRAGMIPENSFLASMKPEFGKLNTLLNHAAIETQGNKDFGEALIEMSNRTNSVFFKDTIRIIAEGLRSGAELHVILENLATNLLQNESIRNDMKAQVRSYSLFIFIASTIAAPLLYGVSSFLIGILDSIGGLSGPATNVPTGAVGIFSSFSLPHVSVTLVLTVAVINVVITTASSAFLNGILTTGKAKNGLKQLPAFVGIGLAIFFVVRIGVSILFAGQLGGGSGTF